MNTNDSVSVTKMASEMGVTVSEVETLLRSLRYRKEYNRRPEVVAKRRKYNQGRQEMMKEARRIMRENPELVKGVQ